MSPVLDAKHDHAHPVEDDSAWSESYYFNCYDPEGDVGFFTRIGVRPNEGTIDAGLSVWLPGSGLGHRRGIREQREMVDGVLEVDGVRYEMVEPMRRWRLTAAEGDESGLAMDVTFDSLMPAIGADGQGRSGQGVSASTRLSTGKGHLEQAGRWSGWIEAGGERVQLGGDARGNRDKSWGPRRWGGPRMWRWFSINVGDEVHFGGIRIGTEAGDLHRGWVWKDGEGTSIREWDVSTELEDDGLTHQRVRVTATDKRDRAHVLDGELLRVAPVRSTETTIVNEGLTRWSYEGATGYGIAEYLHQLDSNGRPVVPIE
jgi:hypothetical protein